MQPGELLPDFSAIFARKDRIVSANSTGRETMASRGIVLLEGSAKFISGQELDVNGRVLSADAFVIATGASPVIPQIDGLDGTGCWTSYNAVYPDRQPESLVIIGGSAVGCEFAQIYSRLGTRVTLLEVRDKLMGEADDEQAGMLAGMFEAGGIEVITGADVRKVAAVADGKLVIFETASGESERTADEVLIATGRAPVVEGLSLGTAGVAMDGGAVSVDETMATSNKHIWACGDVTGTPMYSHVATYEGIVAGHNGSAGADGKKKLVDHRVIPGALFTDPPFAFVGMTEQEALDADADIKVGRAFFSDTGRAEAMGETQGMVKIIAAGGSGELLGAHIFGPGADMLIHEAVIVMGSRLGIDSLLRPKAIHVHPTLSETVARAAAGAR